VNVARSARAEIQDRLDEVHRRGSSLPRQHVPVFHERPRRDGFAAIVGAPPPHAAISAAATISMDSAARHPVSLFICDSS